jgi:16S rRNA (cytidine1402-2'-O)-methyltransferase
MWRDITVTIVLYEAPHHLMAVLSEIKACWGDRRIVLGRELTKMYEEFFRGSISESLAWLSEKPPRGEFTIVLEGGEGKAISDIPQIPPLDSLRRLLATGADKKESIRQTAKTYGMAKRELYQQLLAAETAREDKQ